MNKKFFVLTAMMLLMPVMMGAQTLKGSYFLDNSLNRNKLNPAFAPNVDYFQIPVIGNFGLGIYSNLNLTDFLYPMNGEVYTFLHQDVTFKQFDAALARKPYLDLALDANLINFGWKWGRGYWTVDVGMRVNGDIDVPRDLFTFMKQGTNTSEYHNVGGMKVNAVVSATAAIGYSRDLSDVVPGLRVGAKLRAIMPAGYIGANIDEISLTANPDAWTIKTNGVLHTAVKGLNLAFQDGMVTPEIDPSALGLAGFGFSVDLGAEYKLDFDGFINGVHFSAAITDLGKIFYNKDAIIAYKSEREIVWAGIDNILDPDAINETVNDLSEDFMKLLELEEMEDPGKILGSTTPSFYVGAEMPFLNNTMSVGLLYSARKSWKYTRHEMTLSYNANPLPWLAAGVNYSFLNTGRTLGFMLEFIPRIGPCFYIGTDYFIMSWAKAPDGLEFGGLTISHLPLASRLNLQLGLSFAVGSKEENRQPRHRR